MCLRCSSDTVLCQTSQRSLLLCARAPTRVVWTKGGKFSGRCSTAGSSHKREQYGCLADLLRRERHVEEAEAVSLDMPMRPHASQWGALMSSCRMHNDITVLANMSGKRLIELGPQHGGCYSVQFNLYAVNGRRDNARAIRHRDG